MQTVVQKIAFGLRRLGWALNYFNTMFLIKIQQSAVANQKEREREK